MMTTFINGLNNCLFVDILLSGVISISYQGNITLSCFYFENSPKPVCSFFGFKFLKPFKLESHTWELTKSQIYVRIRCHTEK